MTDSTSPSPPPPASPPPSWRYRVVVVLAIALAVAALVAGVRATETGGDDPVTINGRPDVVERVQPPSGAEALQQAEIGIDLAPGYEGALSLNGTPIPTRELRIVPEQNQVFFAPGPDRTFEALPSGQSCVTATVWRSSEGRGPGDETFRWCFDVT